MYKIFLILSLLIYSAHAQQLLISGRVLNETNQALSYANIRVAGTTTGTSANIEGKYELRLNQGNYKLIASYIGFISDTIAVNLDHSQYEINFILKQTNLVLQEITVTPGINPALEIVRNAITKKNERNKFINEYQFKAYTKGILKTPEDISARDRTTTLSIGTSDNELKITGILENQSEGFYKKPSDYKEIIIARKQSANFPPALNIFTGGRLIQNFYDDEVNFLGQRLKGPLADDALDHYDYTIQKNAAIDDKHVYVINITPLQDYNPGFTGLIYITDKTYNLIRVDLAPNRAANTAGVFDSIHVMQQFNSFDNDIYMPVDYHMFASANILGLARFQFHLNTVLYDYIINPGLDDNTFSKAIVTVLPDADQKQDEYWSSIITIPTTSEEKAAYERIDSVNNQPYSFWDNFSLLSTRIGFNNAFSITGPLSLYHFNRVEGHAIDLGFFLDDALNKRLNNSLRLSYGFSDKKLKTDLQGQYLLGDYRTYSLSGSLYNKLNTLFGGSENYNELTASLLALISKFEFRDYFYSTGGNILLEGEIFPVIKLRAGYINYTDNSAIVNSNFSFFKKDEFFRVNPSIYETRISAIQFGVGIDFRDYIEDGFYRRRTSAGKSFWLFNANVTLSDNSLLSTGLNFIKYDLTLSGRLNGFRNTGLNYRIFSTLTDGTLPFQRFYSLPSNINLISKNNTFRTLNVNEMIGDKAVSVFLNYEWGAEFFRLLKFPILRDLELTFSTFVNAAYLETGSESKSILNYQLPEFKSPFYEAGFGISHILIPLKLEFSWKLNYRGQNNFRIGLNSIAF
jgi:hypothetical protein